MAADEVFKTGVQKAIASLAAVPENLVTVTLTVVARRLEASSEARRRLSSGIEAAYSIVIPVASDDGSSVANVDDVKSALEDVTPDVAKSTITSAIQDSVDASVWSTYESTLNSMSVDSMVAPEVTTNPDLVSPTPAPGDVRGQQKGPGQADSAQVVAAPNMKALAAILALLAPAMRL